MTMVAEDYWRAQPPERVHAILMAALRELRDVEDTLAEALGYQRSDGGQDDPNGGGFVIGEHAPLTLAMEAATELKRNCREIPPRPGL